MTDLRIIPDVTSSFVDHSPISFRDELTATLWLAAQKVALIIVYITILFLISPVSVPGECGPGWCHNLSLPNTGAAQ